MTSNRPSQTTMEGMLWNANHVLDSALDPKNGAGKEGEGGGGIPKELMEKCHGVVLISVVEAGFIFSGSVGTGVIMAHYPEWGTWSAPSAVSLHGMGFGFFVGKGARDVVILIMDPTLDEISGNAEIRFGADVDHTFTGIGGKDDVTSHGSVDFVRGSHSFVYSKGFFTGASLGSSVLAARHKENARFYGKTVTPREIMFEGDKVTVPEGSGVPTLHEKLNCLEAGKTFELCPKKTAVKESLRVSANMAAEEAKADQVDELEYVEAEKEAEKEQAATGDGDEDAADGTEEPAKEEAATEAAAKEEGEGDTEAEKEQGEGVTEDKPAKEEATKDEEQEEAGSKEEDPKEEKAGSEEASKSATEEAPKDESQGSAKEEAGSKEEAIKGEEAVSEETTSKAEASTGADEAAKDSPKTEPEPDPKAADPKDDEAK